MKTATRKIGSNRGKPRLWIEGRLLLEHGFTHQTKWKAMRQDDTLVLVASKDGDRAIAGTSDRPIIDINNGELLEGFGPVVSIKANTRLLIVTNEVTQ